MKFISIVFTLVLYCQITYSQNLPPEVHRNDSVWVQDLVIGIEAFVNFKKHIITFNFKELEAIMQSLDSALIADLNHIDKVYIKEVNNFKIGYSEIMLDNQDKLFGHSYLDMIIELEKFLAYPNIYGMLLNPIRLGVNPKLDKQTRLEIDILMNRIQNSINELKLELILEIKKYRIEFENGVPERFHRINQGEISDEEREKYKIIDFLILTNRLTSKN